MEFEKITPSKKQENPLSTFCKEVHGGLEKVLDFFKSGSDVDSESDSSFYNAIKSRTTFLHVAKNNRENLERNSLTNQNLITSGLTKNLIALNHRRGALADKTQELGGPLRVPTSEAKLRQIGDRIQFNKMVLTEDRSDRDGFMIPAIHLHCNAMKKRSLSAVEDKSSKSSWSYRNIKSQPSSPDFTKRMNVGAVARHLLAENCLGNTQVRGGNMKQRKEMSKALFNKGQSLSFDSGMSSRLHTSADNGHPEIACIYKLCFC